QEVIGHPSGLEGGEPAVEGQQPPYGGGRHRRVAEVRGAARRRRSTPSNPRPRNSDSVTPNVARNRPTPRIRNACNELTCSIIHWKFIPKNPVRNVSGRKIAEMVVRRLMIRACALETLVP